MSSRSIQWMSVKIIISACFFYQSIMTQPRSFMVAVDLSNSLDFSNLASVGQGKIYDVIHEINEQLIKPINEKKRQQGESSRRLPYLSFSQHKPLHLTLMSVRDLNSNHKDYDEIVKDLKDFLNRAIASWREKRKTQLPFSAVISNLMWPPSGKMGIWLSLNVNIVREMQDMVTLINTMHQAVYNVGSIHQNCFSDPRFMELVFKKKQLVDEFGLHISLGRFHRSYYERGDVDSVFGLPGSYRKKIDELFQGLPPPNQVQFEITECTLYVKDEHHEIQALQSFPLINKQQESVEKVDIVVK